MFFFFLIDWLSNVNDRYKLLYSLFNYCLRLE